jgi:L-threonylcarbamoyladenylate synthase
MIHEQALLAVTGELTLGLGDSEEVLKSPGRLRKHYSPKAKLIMLSWRDDHDLRQQIAICQSSFPTCHIITHTRIPSAEGFGGVSVIPHDAEAFGRALYAELHACDEAGAELIVVEALPESAEWGAIADRLKRATAP